MPRLTQTPAAKPPGASPGLSHWLGLHGVLIGMAVLLIQAFPKQGLGWVPRYWLTALWATNTANTSASVTAGMGNFSTGLE